MKKLLFLLSLTLLFLITARAQAHRPIQDIMLSEYRYPYEVHYLNFKSQEQDLKMAYMDVHPQKANGKTVVLLHGKNFNGAYWRETINALTKAGFRVIAPDQIGFGKSSKPAIYQFTFQQLALNTKAILDQLKIERFAILGHSMGGMLAVRFTLMYPDRVEKLILENPIGLEDWKLVAPYSSIDDNYQTELKASYESIYNYQLKSYYDNKWKTAYDEWLYPLTDWIKHPDYPIVAKVNAQTSDMIFTQPVLYEFANISTPTLLIIGTRDRTAIGRNLVKDKAVQDNMGQYQLLGKQAQRAIKGAQLVELDNLGHMPHIEDFNRFIISLMDFLKKSN